MFFHTTRRTFSGTILALVSVTVLLMAPLSDPASAGPLRFLFGGGDNHQPGWEDRSHRTWEDRSRRTSQDRSSRQRVAFDSRYEPGTIVVSFTDRHLYYVTQPGEAFSYLIGTPTGDAKWSGKSLVSEKRVNPRWIPTADMRAEDPALPPKVPGGHPRNPLGVRALYLGDTMYRIHGTDAPSTVGKEVTHGCIRLYNNDIIDLYNRVPIGTPVVVTWESFRVAATMARGFIPERESVPTPGTTVQSLSGWHSTVQRPQQ